MPVVVWSRCGLCRYREQKQQLEGLQKDSTAPTQNSRPNTPGG